jgi:hypothetical protein
MRGWARSLSLCFAAGVVGALANSAGVGLGGEVGLHRALGVAIAPALTKGFLYPRLVWGGLWGGLLLLPFPAAQWVRRGLLIGLVPAAVQLLVIFPYVAGKGMLGHELGAATPVVVVLWNLVWGVAASGWQRWIRG